MNPNIRFLPYSQDLNRDIKLVKVLLFTFGAAHHNGA
jgi:hypothetical protein